MPPDACSPLDVGVIGTINRDTIYRPDGRIVHSWGGILYTLYYLNQHRLRTRPAVNVGRDCEEEISDILSGMPYVCRSAVRTVESRNNHCELHYTNHDEKSEILHGGVSPLTISSLSPLLNARAVIVNFISGRDVALTALEEFRRRFDGLIYMDIHSLTLGRSKVVHGYRRYHRRPRYWQRYAGCADFVQMNRTEFEVLAKRSCSDDSIKTFSHEHLRNDQVLIVTIGKDGAIVCTGSGSPICRHVSSRKVTRPFDTTGCGDVFGAGFVASYLRTQNLTESVLHGHELAGQRAVLRGPLF
jgi:sugar/nucleoside kinase (ribokinase family)